MLGVAAGIWKRVFFQYMTSHLKRSTEGQQMDLPQLSINALLKQKTASFE